MSSFLAIKNTNGVVNWRIVPHLGNVIYANYKNGGSHNIKTFLYVERDCMKMGIPWKVFTRNYMIFYIIIYLNASLNELLKDFNEIVYWRSKRKCV